VHICRVPLLPLVLLAASRIDTNKSCSVLIFDEWLQVSLCAEDAFHLLKVASVLRCNLQLRLETLVKQVVTSGVSLDCVSSMEWVQHHNDVVPEMRQSDMDVLTQPTTESGEVPPELIALANNHGSADLVNREFERMLLNFLESKIASVVQPLNESEIKAFRVDLSKDTEPSFTSPIGYLNKSESLDVSPKPVIASNGNDQSAPSGTPEPNKFGAKIGECVKITPWLIFNSLRDTINVDSRAVSDQLSVSWKCEKCENTFYYTRGEARDHKQNCQGSCFPGV